MKKTKFTPLWCIFCLIFFISGCTMLGKQAPEWEEGSFTPDGKYYVYLYNIYDVSYYSQQGGMTHRSGTWDYYLQIIDCATQKPLLNNPIRFKEHPFIGDISNNYIWFNIRGVEKKNGVAIFDFAQGKLKYSAQDLQKINPHIPFGHGYFYKRPEASEIAIYQADDGREYIINPNTGVFQLAKRSYQEIISSFFNSSTNLVHSIPGLTSQAFSGTRVKFQKGSDATITTADDFLNPKFLSQSTNKQKPTTIYYRDYFFILSQTTRDNHSDLILSMVDQNSLQTAWKIYLAEDKEKEISNSAENYRFYQKEDKLWVANQSYFKLIDLKSGQLISQTALY